MAGNLVRRLSRRFGLGGREQRRKEQRNHPGAGGDSAMGGQFQAPKVDVDPRKQLLCKVLLLDQTDMTVVVKVRV